MRGLMLLTAMLIAGCATQPAAKTTTASSGGAIAASDAQRLELARNLNLKVIDKDGQQLFCRSNFMTASRIQRDTTCYTADQLEKMEAQQQREFDQLNNRPNNPAQLPSGH